MGDCRVRVTISRSLFADAAVGTAIAGGDSGASGRNNSARDDEFVVFTRVWASDTTVREVVEDETLLAPQGMGVTLLSLLRGGDDESTTKRKAALWDCTVNPPKDVTDLPLVSFSDRQGVRSKTLSDAGWFPSASLRVLPLGRTPQIASMDQYDDYQYNCLDQAKSQPDRSRIQPRVQLKTENGNGNEQQMLLTSQVLKSASARFGEEDDAMRDVEAAAARRERIMNKKVMQAKEESRLLKLDRRIRALEESSAKNKTVSDQVQKMLIKSRAIGESRLKMQDRVYLRCIVDKGETTSEEYRYFSPQDTVGKILSAFSVPDGWQSELLIRRQQTEATSELSYRRLPVLLRLYESMSEKFVSEFDKVVIRCYDPSVEEATMNVEAEEDKGSATSSRDEHPAEPTVPEASSPLPGNTEMSDSDHPEGLFVDATTSKRVFDSILALEGNSGATSKKKKKQTASAIKVHQMKMKSNSKGDAKRIKKVEDRFFVELIIVRDDGVSEGSDSGTPTTASMSPIFVAKSDSFERLVRDCLPLPSSPAGCSNYELLVPVSTCDESDADESSPSFRKIVDTKMTLQKAETYGILRPFDRLIVRLFPK